MNRAMRTILRRLHFASRRQPRLPRPTEQLRPANVSDTIKPLGAPTPQHIETARTLLWKEVVTVDELAQCLADQETAMKEKFTKALQQIETRLPRELMITVDFDGNFSVERRE